MTTLESKPTKLSLFLKQLLKDILNIFSFIGKTHKAESGDFTNEQIAGTPFRLIGDKDKGYCIVLGEHRLTDIVRKKQQAIDFMEKKHWLFLTNVTIAICLETNKQNKKD